MMTRDELKVMQAEWKAELLAAISAEPRKTLRQLSIQFNVTEGYLSRISREAGIGRGRHKKAAKGEGK